MILLWSRQKSSCLGKRVLKMLEKRLYLMLFMLEFWGASIGRLQGLWFHMPKVVLILFLTNLGRKQKGAQERWFEIFNSIKGEPFLDFLETHHLKCQLIFNIFIYRIFPFKKPTHIREICNKIIDTKHLFWFKKKKKKKKNGDAQFFFFLKKKKKKNKW